LFVILSGLLEPLPDQRHLVARCCNTLLRFLLEGVEDVDNACEADGVDGSIGFVIVVIHYFQYARTASGKARRSSRLDTSPESLHHANISIAMTGAPAPSTSTLIRGHHGRADKVTSFHGFR
jgi:hypothetical protein